MSEVEHTVLILDDNDAVRESFAGFFEDRGWRVLAVASAEAALTQLESETPDGAVVDLRLPGMDGSTFIRRVGVTHPTMASVICTGSPEYRPPEDIVDLDQVSSTVFYKPVGDLNALEEELRDHIQKSRAIRSSE